MATRPSRRDKRAVWRMAQRRARGGARLDSRRGAACPGKATKGRTQGDSGEEDENVKYIGNTLYINYRETIVPMRGKIARCKRYHSTMMDGYVQARRKAEAEYNRARIVLHIPIQQSVRVRCNILVVWWHVPAPSCAWHSR